MVLREEEHETSGSLGCEEQPFSLPALVFTCKKPPQSVVAFPASKEKAVTNTVLSRDLMERLFHKPTFILFFSTQKLADSIH